MPEVRFDLPEPTTPKPAPAKQEGYYYPIPEVRFELPEPTTPKPAPIKQEGYFYPVPEVRFNLPEPTTPRPIQSTYLPPPPAKQEGYFYPVPEVRFDLPKPTTPRPIPSTYLPPTTRPPPPPTVCRAQYIVIMIDRNAYFDHALEQNTNFPLNFFPTENLNFQDFTLCPCACLMREKHLEHRKI